MTWTTSSWNCDLWLLWLCSSGNSTNWVAHRKSKRIYDRKPPGERFSLHITWKIDHWILHASLCPIDVCSQILRIFLKSRITWWNSWVEVEKWDAFFWPIFVGDFGGCSWSSDCPTRQRIILFVYDTYVYGGCCKNDVFVTLSLQHSQFYIPTLMYTHHISSSMQHQWPPGRSVKNPTGFIRFKLKVCACVKSYWVISLCDLMSVYEYVYIIIYIYDIICDYI